MSLTRSIVSIAVTLSIAGAVTAGCSSAPPEENTAAAGEALSSDHVLTPDVSCGDACSGASVLLCTVFGVEGSVACGLGSIPVCDDVCNLPGKRCSNLPGGKACMNYDRMWWCDEKVDGRHVYIEYYMDDLADPGLHRMPAAPRMGCDIDWAYGFRNVSKFRVCVDDEGCAGWVNASP